MVPESFIDVHFTLVSLRQQTAVSITITISIFTIIRCYSKWLVEMAPFIMKMFYLLCRVINDYYITTIKIIYSMLNCYATSAFTIIVFISNNRDKIYSPGCRMFFKMFSQEKWLWEIVEITFLTVCVLFLT